MKQSKKILMVLVAAVIGLMTIPPAQAGVTCHKINAKGAGNAVDDGDGNPFTARTQAQITGGGLLQGTTEANFVITGFSGSVASFSGTLVVTTTHGTLTLHVDGTLDLATGNFAATGAVTSGTGRFSEASGELVFEGTQNLVDGSFVETITGDVCLDLAP